MKKLLLILLLSSISTQTIARVGEVYHCEFYSYVHIPSKENTYNDDINTNWLGEKSKKFTDQISILAEEENHHPDISFGWGYCKVKIFTHSIKGLAESDFILAAKIDKI